MSDRESISRRAVISGAAVTAGAALLHKLGVGTAGAAEAPQQADVAGMTSAVSARSAFETPARTPTGLLTGSSLTPLHELTGTMTPNDLLFERHHSGIPTIDPKAYRLMVHGLVDRPMMFTLDELRRFPSVSRVYFIECAGNGRAAYREPKPTMTPQMVDGLTSNGEWTGVPLRVILAETGVK